MQAFVIISQSLAEKAGAVVLKKENTYLSIKLRPPGYDVYPGYDIQKMSGDLDGKMHAHSYCRERVVKDHIWTRALQYFKAQQGDSKSAERNAKIALELALGSDLWSFMRIVGTPLENLIPGHEFRERIRRRTTRRK